MIAFKGAKMIAFKGATMYEWQLGKLYGGICHLTGGHFTWWAFWRRFSIHWEQS